MSNDWLKELDKNFKDNPNYQALSDKEEIRIIDILEKIMDLGMGAAYGDEAEDAADGCIDCSIYIDQC